MFTYLCMYWHLSSFLFYISLPLCFSLLFLFLFLHLPLSHTPSSLSLTPTHPPHTPHTLTLTLPGKRRMSFTMSRPVSGYATPTGNGSGSGSGFGRDGSASGSNGGVNSSRLSTPRRKSKSLNIIEISAFFLFCGTDFFFIEHNSFKNKSAMFGFILSYLTST